MNVRVEINGQPESEGSDNYGAGGAYPTRGAEWVAREVELTVAGLIVPNADDGDEAVRNAGIILVNVETKGQWPDVLEFVGTVKSSRGTEPFIVTLN